MKPIPQATTQNILALINNGHSIHAIALQTGVCSGKVSDIWKKHHLDMKRATGGCPPLLSATEKMLSGHTLLTAKLIMLFSWRGSLLRRLGSKSVPRQSAGALERTVLCLCNSIPFAGGVRTCQRVYTGCHWGTSSGGGVINGPIQAGVCQLRWRGASSSNQDLFIHCVFSLNKSTATCPIGTWLSSLKPP